MRKDKLNTQDNVAVDRLLDEVNAILHSSNDLNADREKLSSIFSRIVHWKEDGGRDDKYFNHFQEMMMSMASLNFSKRLPLNSNQKSLQNLISYSLNWVNQQLEEKAFSKGLYDTILKEFELKDHLIIITNYDGIVQSFFSNLDGFPTNGFEGKHIDVLFQDKEKIKNLQTFEPKESIEMNMDFGGFSRTVKVKVRSTPFKVSEGIAFIVQL
jgi:hypothetical protein